MESFPWAEDRANVPVTPAPLNRILTDNLCSASGDAANEN